MTEFAPYTYPAPAFVPYSNARPLGGRALVATVALALTIVTTIASASLGFFILEITGDATLRGDAGGDGQAVAILAAVAGLITIGALLFAGIAFICWLHRARTNIDAFGGSWMRWGPGWTIGAWFVPLANLVIPLLVVAEIDRATDGHTGGWALRRPARVVVTLWAVLWTAFLILDRVTTFVPLDAVSSAAGYGLMALAAAVEVGAAVCAILVIRRITAGQEAVMSGAAFGGVAVPDPAFPGHPAPHPRPAPGPVHTSAPYSAAGDTWEAGLANGPIGWDTPAPGKHD